eukprot:194588-Chlamydomonas_euryale.AAC.2
MSMARVFLMLIQPQSGHKCTGHKCVPPSKLVTPKHIGGSWSSSSADRKWMFGWSGIQKC